MRRRLKSAQAFAAILSLASAAGGAPASADPVDPTTEYIHDAITAATPGRHAAVPTATCQVWANAEGLGLGPSQLGGLHGVGLEINLHPLPTDGRQPTTLEAGLAAAKARFPNAPAWLWATIERNRDAIESACAKDLDGPVKVHAISAKDRRG